jgi:hypothetical protein
VCFGQGQSIFALSRPDLRQAWQVFRQNARLLFYGNLLGYLKLLQRSLDVLAPLVFGDQYRGEEWPIIILTVALC